MHQAEAPSDPAGTLFHKNASDNELFALFMTETTVFLEVIINQIPNIDFCISTKEAFLINHKMYLFCCCVFCFFCFSLSTVLTSYLFSGVFGFSFTSAERWKLLLFMPIQRLNGIKHVVLLFPALQVMTLGEKHFWKGQENCNAKNKRFKIINFYMNR